MKKDFSQKNSLLQSLPSVDEILKSNKGNQWRTVYPKRIVTDAIREGVALRRKAILESSISDFSFEKLFVDIERLIEKKTAYRLKQVINATGIIVHTNLGRSPLSDDAVSHMVTMAKGYSNLEYNLARGIRGKRYNHVESLLCELTGAEAGFVVNNNAAAVLITLNTLAKGKEIIVSRGELIEIGGSFRMPDVMQMSGAILKEVGTTNKTHPADYERAINDSTAAIFKVHPSNYRIIGFTEEVEIEKLVELGQKTGLPVIFDLGSGCLVDLNKYGIPGEPVVMKIVEKGVDLTTFSGDKLLGGPQAGIIVGKKAIIEKIRKNPLARAVRIDKLTLAALESTLMAYLDEEKVLTRLPTLRMLVQSLNEIEERANALFREFIKLSKKNNINVNIKKDNSQAGGGSLPSIDLPTFVVTLECRQTSANTFAKLLRKTSPAVVTRIKDDKLYFDLRTIAENEIKAVAHAANLVLQFLNHEVQDKHNKSE